ncbi:hypothetical protein CFAM422_013059 [Trichoderma lentiforme]|uniref:Uncharacterized protein n=1 Tax=Trichoderma lentiforme TaxID=1567552 RepID=A0A9P4X379_9HYPO|nr:hypothetical protein CFAM422_013059 [Trichoderma lentiforme]
MAIFRVGEQPPQIADEIAHVSPMSAASLPARPHSRLALFFGLIWLIGDSSLRWDCKSHRAVINFAR